MAAPTQNIDRSTENSDDDSGDGYASAEDHEPYDLDQLTFIAFIAGLPSPSPQVVEQEEEWPVHKGPTPTPPAQVESLRELIARTYLELKATTMLFLERSLSADGDPRTIFDAAGEHDDDQLYAILEPYEPDCPQLRGYLRTTETTRILTEFMRAVDCHAELTISLAASEAPHTGRPVLPPAVVSDLNSSRVSSSQGGTLDESIRSNVRELTSTPPEDAEGAANHDGLVDPVEVITASCEQNVLRPLPIRTRGDGSGQGMNSTAAGEASRSLQEQRKWLNSSSILKMD